MLQSFYAFIVLGFVTLAYLMLFHKTVTRHRDW